MDAPSTCRSREDAPLAAANPYGATKLMGEHILRDVATADPSFTVACLRYFNPVGAHESGLIGEDPRGTPNNLMPYVARVAVGACRELRVFGGDYPTPDGTGVRDYIHVTDLAEGHVAALAHLLDKREGLTVNLGTGRGHSVLEVVRAYEQASGRPVPYVPAPRGPATWLPAMPIPRWRTSAWAGRPTRSTWRGCAGRQLALAGAQPAWFDP